MKNPDNRAFLMLRVLALEPKEGADTGSSIRFRMSLNSDLVASAIFRDAWLRKLSWHQFSTLKSGKGVGVGYTH